jgi:hypothetical protein
MLVRCRRVVIKDLPSIHGLADVRNKSQQKRKDGVILICGLQAPFVVMDVRVGVHSDKKHL